jgi:hypothetical protein
MGLVVAVEESDTSLGECVHCGNPWGKHWIDVAEVFVGLGVRLTSTEDLVMQVSMCERCGYG